MEATKAIIPSGSTLALTEEEIQRREKVPKRATIINTCLFVVVTVLSIIFIGQSEVDPETKTFMAAISSTIMMALRNPIIACWAFQVNRQIRRETVEERRNKEIEEALKKRAERRNQARADQVPESNTSNFDPTAPKVSLTETTESGREKCCRIGPSGHNGTDTGPNEPMERLDQGSLELEDLSRVPKSDPDDQEKPTGPDEAFVEGSIQFGHINQRGESTRKQNSIKPEELDIISTNKSFKGKTKYVCE